MHPKYAESTYHQNETHFVCEYSSTLKRRIYTPMLPWRNKRLSKQYVMIFQLGKIFLIRDVMSSRLRPMMKLDKIILLRVDLYFGFQLREMRPHPKPIGLFRQTKVNIISYYAKMFKNVKNGIVCKISRWPFRSCRNLVVTTSSAELLGQGIILLRHTWAPTDATARIRVWST